MNSKILNFVKLTSVTNNIETVLEDTGIRYLWHYTSPDSFIKIVSGEQLRLTDCLFLNDIEEFNYIFKVLEEYQNSNRKNKSFLQRVSSVLFEDNYDYIISRNTSTIRFAKGRYYILSGSSNSDSLPLWTYYSKTGKYDGYAMKLDIAKLYNDFEIYNQGEMFVGKVEYDLNNQLTIIEDRIERIVCELDERIKELDINNLTKEEYFNEIRAYNEQAQCEAVDFLNTCRLFFKNEKFAFESELRVAVLISLEKIGENKCEVAFSSVGGVIKPSIGLSLKKDFPIVGLNIGPMVDLELAKIGVERLLESKEIKNDKKFVVEKSKLKIRY